MQLIFKLFLSFIQVGLFSVGGGYAAIPLIQNQIVNRHHLMTLDEFTDLITIAEMTPGSISINSATFVGMRLSGVGAVIICTFGCILPSILISIILAKIYYKYRELKAVQIILSALRPAMVALIGGAGLSILLSLFDLDVIKPDRYEILYIILFAGALFILRQHKTSAVKIIFGTGFVGTICYMVLSQITI